MDVTLKNSKYNMNIMIHHVMICGEQNGRLNNLIHLSENEVYPKKNQLNGNIIMNHEILGYHMFNQTHLYKRMRCLRFALTWRNIHSLWPLSSGK